MSQKDTELTQEEKDYLAARRVRSQHSWFMREVVEPARKENT